MPRCMYHEGCNFKNRLTVFIFYDPQNILIEQSFLCQAHSDQIIGRFMQKYEEKVSEINFLNQRRKEEGKIRGYYDPNDTKINELIRMKYSEKKKISNYVCRSLICNNGIFKNQLRYSVFTIHVNGNFRHYFYFCSLKCVNQMRAFVGLRVPILENQHTIN